MCRECGAEEKTRCAGTTTRASHRTIGLFQPFCYTTVSVSKPTGLRRKSKYGNTYKGYDTFTIFFTTYNFDAFEISTPLLVWLLLLLYKYILRSYSFCYHFVKHIQTTALWNLRQKGQKQQFARLQEQLESFEDAQMVEDLYRFKKRFFPTSPGNALQLWYSLSPQQQVLIISYYYRQLSSCNRT